jgi:hypothetical protein
MPRPFGSQTRIVPVVGITGMNYRGKLHEQELGVERKAPLTWENGSMMSAIACFSQATPRFRLSLTSDLIASPNQVQLSRSSQPIGYCSQRRDLTEGPAQGSCRRPGHTTAMDRPTRAPHRSTRTYGKEDPWPTPSIGASLTN